MLNIYVYRFYRYVIIKDKTSQFDKDIPDIGKNHSHAKTSLLDYVMSDKVETEEGSRQYVYMTEWLKI